MDKQQAAEAYARKDGNKDFHIYAARKEGHIAGWEAHEAQSPSQSDAVAFAEWLYENRWFYFDRSTQKWHYTFEQGTSIPKKTYEKLYVKTTTELYKLFNPSGAAEPPDPFIEKHLANIKELQAHYAKVHAEVVANATPENGFDLSKDDLKKLLSQCLKPEEISGEVGVQQARIKELMHWFKRFAEGKANAKWLHGHAFELAYYIATRQPAAPPAAGPVWVKMELTIPNDWENEIIRSIGHKLTHDTAFWSRTKDGFHDDHTGNKYKASELEWLCEERISLNLLLRTVVRKAWLGNYQLNTLSDDITIDENFVFTEADKWFDSNFENIATTPLGLFALEDMKKAFDAGYDHGDPQNVWSLDFEGFMKTDFPNSKT